MTKTKTPKIRSRNLANERSTVTTKKLNLKDQLPLPDIYYESPAYWIKDSKGIWMSVPASGIRKHLKESGFSGLASFGGNSEVDAILCRIERENRVDYAGALAGCGNGIRSMNNRLILVTEGPTVIEPREGPYPHLTRLFSSMFGDVQLPYAYGWLKIAYESFVDCVQNQASARPGQAFVMAGPVNSGKSLVQTIITNILGGRRAYPYAYLRKTTDFNADLCKAESLVIDDEFGTSDYKSRLALAAGIKNLLVSPAARCHPKGRTAFEVLPFWRLTICVNDNEESLRVLPVMNEDIADKLMLFKVQRANIDRSMNRDGFMALLKDELPAFVFFLVNTQTSAIVAEQRFGVATYHNPDILEDISSLAPETRLYELLHMSTDILHSDPWEGSATELISSLTAVDSRTRSSAQDLLHSPSSCGQFLGRLEAKYPEQIQRLPRRNNVVHWRITVPRPE